MQIIFDHRILTSLVLAAIFALCMSTAPGKPGKPLVQKSRDTDNSNPAEVLRSIDAIEKLIEKIPAEHLADVQTAVNKIFLGRQSSELVNDFKS